MREPFNITGRCKIQHIRDGKVLFEHEGENIVTIAGKILITQFVEVSPGPTRPSHMALGDDATPAADTQTTLENETGREVLLGTVRVNNEISYGLLHTAGGPELVNECGIFNDPAAGTMLCRFLTQTVNLAIGDTLLIAWTLNFGG